MRKKCLGNKQTNKQSKLTNRQWKQQKKVNQRWFPHCKLHACSIHWMRCCWNRETDAMLNRRWFIKTEERHANYINRLRGLMDKASAHGAGDCGFESCQVHGLPCCKCSVFHELLVTCKPACINLLARFTVHWKPGSLYILYIYIYIYIYHIYCMYIYTVALI